MADLDGTVALVTGASTGIGRALAEGLAARGASVAGLARGAERLSAAMADVATATGSRTLAVSADVADLAAVRAAVARVEAELGPVDLLVNNAGLIDAAEVPVWEADPEQWWSVVESQVRGPFHLVQAVVPGMVARGTGRVVDIASGMSTRSNPDYTAYSVGKTGQLRITEALAASGVLAFDVAPGVVDTPMTRSMAMWDGYEEWTPVEAVVDLVAAIGAGRLDAWSGRFVRAGKDTVESLSRVTPAATQRQLRLLPHGDDDPVA
ncbi:SDR family oxidoreductase [Modestobacter sp. Leaf380]|uniref:SDR family NAD(P)-dependent oxidoreductase n=1 Tax=Modestobacter sp. Leaf380 TaxID=1736356 RepID=UPI0006FFED67|nr:SDR family NAD(P)-dependent oxidoreductase [Modestobacter sp. Leaf380]KQS69390.1 3-oxoacyl-ACP reductase [Modestobacter sp. Leaf380]